MSQNLHDYFDRKQKGERPLIQSTKNPLLPDELVLWEGKSARLSLPFLFALTFFVFVVPLAGLAYYLKGFIPYIVGTLVVVTIFSALLTLGFWLISSRQYYTLTSERLLIQSKDSGIKKVTNCTFEQILEVRYVRGWFGSYVEILTLSTEIPSKLRPSKEPQKFYEALSQLVEFVQANRPPEDIARDYRLYNPPLKRWILFVIVRALIVFVLIITYTLLPLPLRPIFWIVFIFINLFSPYLYRILLYGRFGLARLILGNEYNRSMRFSPTHSRIEIAAWAIMFLLGFWLTVISMPLSSSY